ncbi:hypothetical protein KIPB_001043 [Kipferlia bialata]|uniref:Uncharacterized protein n=1 Tax=Kipferlia bialata TaxID=797122 RepID=A0A9K3CQ19_9EUKA|nr:hypothetical protein KIPB_001043 [Kipferlia bialata]|eukprot:g1043.t1
MDMSVQFIRFMLVLFIVYHHSPQTKIWKRTDDCWDYLPFYGTTFWYAFKDGCHIVIEAFLLLTGYLLVQSSLRRRPTALPMCTHSLRYVALEHSLVYVQRLFRLWLLGFIVHLMRNGDEILTWQFWGAIIGADVTGSRTWYLGMDMLNTMANLPLMLTLARRIGPGKAKDGYLRPVSLWRYLPLALPALFLEVAAAWFYVKPKGTLPYKVPYKHLFSFGLGGAMGAYRHYNTVASKAEREKAQVVESVPEDCNTTLNPTPSVLRCLWDTLMCIVWVSVLVSIPFLAYTERTNGTSVPYLVSLLGVGPVCAILYLVLLHLFLHTRHLQPMRYALSLSQWVAKVAALSFPLYLVHWELPLADPGIDSDTGIQWRPLLDVSIVLGGLALEIRFVTFFWGLLSRTLGHHIKLKVNMPEYCPPETAKPSKHSVV